MSPKVPKTHLLLRGRSRKAWKMWADSILHFAGMETSPIGAKAHRPPQGLRALAGNGIFLKSEPIRGSSHYTLCSLVPAAGMGLVSAFSFAVYYF